MIHLLEVVSVAAVGYAVYKHVSASAIKADVKTAVSRVDATVATIKADLLKYL